MPFTVYRTACSKRWPCRRGDRIKRIPSERHRCPKVTLPMQPWRQSPRRATGQEEAKRLYGQQIAEAADAEETYNDAIKRTLEKTEALEKHVKTVTMRQTPWRPPKRTSSRHSLCAKRKQCGTSMCSMANCASPAPRR